MGVDAEEGLKVYCYLTKSGGGVSVHQSDDACWVLVFLCDHSVWTFVGKTELSLLAVISACSCV